MGHRINEIGRPLEGFGEIEIRCQLDDAEVSDRVGLVFGAHADAEPPFVIKIWSPSGKEILNRTIARELPTGEPQSAPPIEFIPLARGEYRIRIQQVRGKQSGEATLHVK